MIKFLIGLFFIPTLLYSQFKLGVDVLLSERMEELKSQKVGVICNSSSITFRGISLYKYLLNKGVNLTVIFAPEHGFLMEKESGEKNFTASTIGNTPIISLYGKKTSPAKEDMDLLDVLLVDLQDVGVRTYTYISTVRLCMIEADKYHKKIVVLDRPNPISPFAPQGPMLDKNLVSFVGSVNIPFVSSMTMGEIANYIKQTELPSLALEVIKMKNYSRKKFLEEYIFQDDIPFSPPSPNLTTLNSILCYPIIVLIEATNVSEGRGTDTPFEQFGAPFIDPEQFVKAIPKEYTKGLKFSPKFFTPTPIEGKSKEPKYKYQICHGVSIEIIDKQKMMPFETSIAILYTLLKLYPKDFKIENPTFFDKLIGKSWIQQKLLSHAPIAEILNLIEKEKEDLSKYYLYDK